MIRERRALLLVTTDFPPSIGGIQVWTQQMAAHLAKQHEVTVIAPSQAGCAALDAHLPFRVVRVPAGGPRALGLGLAVGQRLLQRRPDAVLFAHLFAAIAAAPLCTLFQVPYLVVAHGQEVQAPRVQSLLLPMLSRSRACIAISRYTAALLRAKGMPAHLLRVIPNGVDEALLGPVQGDTAIITQYIPPGARVVLTLARLAERYKGHDVVLHALPLIRARVPDVQYVVAGDGVYRPFYEDLAAALHVRDVVTFTGHVSDAARIALLDRCDVFAMLSRQEPSGGGEGFGLVFLEAAARRRPAIGGNSGGIPDAIVDGETGLLVDPTDIPAIAETVIRLLRDVRLARELGNAGYRRVQAGFTWSRVAEDLEGVLDAVLGAGSACSGFYPW
jgi:phosphatidylinositol alpha-1,6-mannosyltransferase